MTLSPITDAAHGAALYVGEVYHKRFAPKQHKLRYRVFTLCCDIDDLDMLDSQLRFFSVNKFNLFSVYEKDHGDPATADSGKLKDRLISLLRDNQVRADSSTTITMLTYPRMIGFAFNPLTVFYCYDADGTPLAVIYEVRNTFGERHNYIFKIPQGQGFDAQHEASKKFHVSPFFATCGRYKFALKPPTERVAVTINYSQDKQRLLTACFAGKRAPLTDKLILKQSLLMPLMTVKVVAGILYEALKLKIKGLRIFPHNNPHYYQSSLAVLRKKTKTKH